MAQTSREQLKVAAEKAVLVGVHLPGSYIDSSDPFRELRALASTAGAKVVGELTQKRERPGSRTYLGKGKVHELAELIRMTGATLVIFDNDLTPAQIRNLEQDLSPIRKSDVNPAPAVKIIDRSELILDIFANRAATHAAKLQVEIAQLEYTYPRLRAMWDHLGQVVGGAPIGIGTRGPGEQQIEIDRRIVQRRLSQLKSELEKVQQRKSREVAARRIDHFTAGLVGYTNAGKSTLFNALTEPSGGGGAYAHGKLFATLSTRVEKWKMPRGNEALLSDTVGFIRDLPHHLVASFRSTLEETIYAHLIVIVVDAADPNAHMQLATVEETLDAIGARDQARLLVLNKIDKLQAAGAPGRDGLMRWLERYPDAIPLSGATGSGLDTLAERALEIMLGGVREVDVTTSIDDARTISFLERKAEVLSRAYDNGAVTLRTRLGRRHVDQLLAAGSPMQLNGQPALDEAKRLWEYAEPRKQALPDPPPHEKFWS